jgi:hypothetical protein
MPAKGSTYKACPGCGEEHYRRVDEVCQNCKNLMSIGRKFVEQNEFLNNVKSYNMPEFATEWTVDLNLLSKVTIEPV